MRLDRTRFGAFFSELVHVVRNAVDHGIERPEERLKSHKPPHGTLTLRAFTTGNELDIEVEDDGAGIDWEAIRRAAKAGNLPHRTQADLLDALCQDGLTTRSEVTALSGRGVGMAAFRQRVITMHGTLEVKSTRGRGTIWRVRFPAADASQSARSGVFAPRSAPKPALVEGSEQH